MYYIEIPTKKVQKSLQRPNVDAARVVIVTDSLVFSDGLTNLLAAKIELLAREMDVNQAINQIKTLKPDIIIWANTGMARDSALQETHLLEATPEFKTLSLSWPATTIITQR